MFVCICNAVTESQIRQAVDEGAVTMADLKQRLAVASCCGCCAEQADEVLHKRLLAIATARIYDRSAKMPSAAGR